MESIATIHHHNTSNCLSFSLHHHPALSKPLFFSSSSLSFKSLSTSKTLSKPLTIKSTSLPVSPNPRQTPTSPLTSFLKTTCITLVTTSLFLSRFTKPSIATPAPPPTLESTTTSTEDTDEEKERNIEEYLDSHPDDTKGLKALMGIKIKNQKFEEAIQIIERLIEIEPSEIEWQLLKAHVYSYSDDTESAKLGFEEILMKNPLLVEAYHGLKMVASQSESDELEDVLKRIESVMEICKKEKKKEELRDFKLLVAQVRVVQGSYIEALKVYQELVKEEPRDFRPYLCQGIIYTLLKKQDEADKQFQKYQRLVPKGHPYASYFEDNMVATKMFSQMGDNQRASSKS